jgi:hypothetical protein
VPLCVNSVNQPTICKDTYGNPFNVSVNTIYTGTTVNQTQASDVNNCMLACDATEACVAVNFIAGNCTEFSSVTGTQTLVGRDSKGSKVKRQAAGTTVAAMRVMNTTAIPSGVSATGDTVSSTAGSSTGLAGQQSGATATVFTTGQYTYSKLHGWGLMIWQSRRL